MICIRGCVVALLGGAIAVLSVYGGFVGVVGAAQDVDCARLWAFMGLGFLGGIIGLIVFVKGIVKAVSEK